MSMLTVQIDQLRTASIWVNLYFANAVNAIPINTAILLEDAADTIEILRNQLIKNQTCRNVSDVDNIFICSECKCQIEGMVVLNGANRWVEPPYCPNCGRKVI